MGALTRRELDQGELAASLAELAATRYRPPGAHGTRQYAVPTLERWYYAYRQGGLEALRPDSRSDRGRGRDLTPEQRQLLCDIRREHPSASVPLILRALEGDGRLAKDAVSASTVRRLWAALVARYEGSGESRQAFAAQAGVGLAALQALTLSKRRSLPGHGSPTTLRPARHLDRKAACRRPSIHVSMAFTS